MKNIKKVLFGFLIVISIVSCFKDKSDEHKYITFVNKSDENIFIQMLWKGTISEADTLYECRLVTGYLVIKDSLYPIKNTDKIGGWETDFKAIPYIQFSVMDGEAYDKSKKEPCDTIRKYFPILHRYQLKLEDLQRMNWTVVYPPEE